MAVFSGVVNLLTLSGSLYMLQVYDRVIPSHNVATLFGLSAIVAVAYLLQGYFDALRGRMLTRIGALFDVKLQSQIHFALVSLPLRGTQPILAQQPLRDLDQIRVFLSGAGPTAFLDMPWIPLFLIALFLFHPAIGVIATCGAMAIIAMTILTERQSRSAAKVSMEGNAQRQVLADALRQNADVIRALGMTGRSAKWWSRTHTHYIHHNTRFADIHTNLSAAAKVLRFVLQSAVLGVGAYLVVMEQASGGIMIASSIMMGRALAPVEVALANWKQLVAAREGISRLRAVLEVTA
ncbi:MAG: ABC transporter transmembrane domain-containing protein, partial [Pseudolabrys sp.]